MMEVPGIAVWPAGSHRLTRSRWVRLPALPDLNLKHFLAADNRLRMLRPLDDRRWPELTRAAHRAQDEESPSA